MGTGNGGRHQHNDAGNVNEFGPWGDASGLRYARQNPPGREFLRRDGTDDAFVGAQAGGNGKIRK